MRLILLILTSFVSLSVYASEDWFCTSQSSKVEGESVKACGVGIGKDENEARLKAFDAAKDEFLRVCAASDGCRDRSTSIEPERTSCAKDATGFKCYRMVRFALGEKSAAKQGLVATARKVRVGMSKADLIATFGAPYSIEHGMNLGSGEYLQAFYKGQSCETADSSCYVIIKDGKVQSYAHFKPEMTDDI